MALIVGVDPSAKKIAIVGYEDITKTHVVYPIKLYAKGQTKQDNLSLLNAVNGMEDFALWVSGVSRDDRVAYVENPVVGRGGASTTIKQAYVGGIIRACLGQAGFTVYDVNVSSWRKELDIKARDSKTIKATTKTTVQTHWPKIMPEVESDGDLIDAAAICLYGRRIRRKATDLRSLAAGPTTGGLSQQ